MAKKIRIHVNKNRIQANHKTEREGRDQPLQPVCRVETYEGVNYGTRIDVRCKCCNRHVISLLSKWDGGKQLHCGATVYLESNTENVEVDVVEHGETIATI